MRTVVSTGDNRRPSINTAINLRVLRRGRKFHDQLFELQLFKKDQAPCCYLPFWLCESSYVYSINCFHSFSFHQASVVTSSASLQWPAQETEIPPAEICQRTACSDKQPVSEECARIGDHKMKREHKAACVTGFLSFEWLATAQLVP